MLSTKNLKAIPDADKLKKLCNALLILDIIVAPSEWLRQFYYYNKWAEGVKVFHYKDGMGNHVHIFFSEEGVVIKGFDHECAMAEFGPDLSPEQIAILENPNTSVEQRREIIRSAPRKPPWAGVLDSLPDGFHDFLSHKNLVKTGTSFCIWKMHDDMDWQIGEIDFPEGEDVDGSEYLLRFFNDKLETYRKHEIEHNDMTFVNGRDFDAQIIQQILDGKLINNEMVSTLNPLLTDLKELSETLTLFGHPFEWN